MVLCINTIVADHFKVPVRDMYNQAFDKVNGRDAFRDGLIVLMALIMEGHGVPIIGINPGSGNNGPAQIPADIFDGNVRGAGIGLGPDIETFGMVFVNLVFKLLKRRSQFSCELVQKDLPESQAQEVIIEMGIGTPGVEVTGAAFGDKGVDVWVPFQVSAEGMEDTDKARGKVLGLVKVEKHPQDDIPDRMEQAVKEGTVLKEKDA